MIRIKKKITKLFKPDPSKGNIHFIIGASRFGSRVAIKYAKAGLYVTVIDKDKNSYYKLGENFLGAFVVGDATKISTLEEANIKNAKNILIATDNDDTNIFLSNLLYKKYGKTSIVVRLEDDDKHDLLISKDIKIINPFVSTMVEFIKIDKED